jgi:demethylmenaquinone methyltransferase/2-methoxy-6-polyprenyl-1,4-benzoquinol methylase
MSKFAHDTIVPYAGSALGKKEQVAEMFDRIAFRYDFLNRFLSAGTDVSWRKKAIEVLAGLQPKSILDVATGTGDMAIMMANRLPQSKIIGIDISEGMLVKGREKLLKAGLEGQISLQSGDSETINYPPASFDAVSVAFGVRNFEHLEKGLKEIFRVLKPGGKLVILEFSKPKTLGIKQLYNLYMGIIAPQVGKIFCKNKDAYQYLNDSVQRFPEGNEFVDILQSVGFTNTTCKHLSFGICSIYAGIK